MGLQSGIEEEHAMTGQNHKRRELAVLLCCSLIILCARQTLCLINEKNVVEPTTSEHVSFNTIENASNASVLNCTSSSNCGTNSPNCMTMCSICDDIFPSNRMICLSELLNGLCLSTFHSAMTESNSDWCVWSNVSGLYSNLSLCTEEISDCLCIPWPNPLVEQKILEIHSEYFQDCPSEELIDPPPVIVFALVITPICLIPVMVSLVVLKTKNGDCSQ
ncbi:receptor activity-modifying protein 2 [Eucyclogobius newberryi]|uniref:receptor activity-modifying protein 2 n=1 Tax=Eucyclogobius newberryi TaxID=166745 RepID=UPI003B5A15CF